MQTIEKTINGLAIDLNKGFVISGAEIEFEIYFANDGSINDVAPTIHKVYITDDNGREFEPGYGWDIDGLKQKVVDHVDWDFQADLEGDFSEYWQSLIDNHADKMYNWLRGK